MSNSSSTNDLWYIVLHGGDDGIGDNIWSYDTSGNLVSDTVLDTSQVHLQELRGFVVLPNGDLYVANAYKEDSAILHFGPAKDRQTPRQFLSVFTSTRTSPGLKHPFNLVVGPDGNIYACNQDTNAVTRYYGPGSSHVPGTPMPPPKPDYPLDIFLQSARVVPTGVKEIRDILFAPDGFLYVADEDRNEVRQYDGKNGEYLRTIANHNDGLDAPVHLLTSPDQTHLYIGSSQNDKVFRYHFSTGHVKTFVHSGDGGLKATGGMAFGNDGWFYVVSRLTNQILRYTQLDGTPDIKPFINIVPKAMSKGRAYNPEFIALVMVPTGQ